MKVSQSGYERRRRDLYGRTRRFLYGLLLLAAAPGAIAADELAYVGQYRALQTPPAATVVDTVLATIQGVVMIHADRAVDPAEPLSASLGYPRVGLDTVTARLQEPSDAPLFRVAVSDGREIRDGMGFDLAVPDFGNFHLNLYARRNARSEGRRWNVNADGEQGPERAWSVGGTLDLVRTVDGDRYVAFVPEVLFDLSGSKDTFLPFQASVRLANWRSLADKRSQDERVPQISFRWRL